MGVFLAESAAQGVSPTGNPESFARAHQQLLADRDIQFDLARFQPPKLPAWVKALGEFLDAIGPGLRILFWVVVALVALFLLYCLVRWLQGQAFAWPWKRRARAAEAAESWQLEEAPARALLVEADALATKGDYSAAAHLLLRRSIEEIDSNRPQLVRPALTSRDIAGAAALPPEPRSAFGRIVRAVEGSLFGGRALGEQDWRDCRAAYEIFVFSPEWQR
jgi:hypothetical protein